MIEWTDGQSYDGTDRRSPVLEHTVGITGQQGRKHCSLSSFLLVGTSTARSYLIGFGGPRIGQVRKDTLRLGCDGEVARRSVPACHWTLQSAKASRSHREWAPARQKPVRELVRSLGIYFF